MNPLGNPHQQTPISVTSTAQAITVDDGISAMELQNWDTSNVVYFGDKDVSSANGGRISASGGFRVFENIKSGWKIYVVCAAGQTATLQRIDYK